MDGMTVCSMLEIRNRPGLFAVLDPRVKKRIEESGAKLYASTDGVVVETVTRNRFVLTRWDPGVRVVGVAVTDRDGSVSLCVS